MLFMASVFWLSFNAISVLKKKDSNQFNEKPSLKYILIVKQAFVSLIVLNRLWS